MGNKKTRTHGLEQGHTGAVRPETQEMAAYIGSQGGGHRTRGDDLPLL